MKNSFLILLIILVFSCRKDCVEDNQCNCPPCFSDIDDNGNKVAWIPEYRIGKWANISGYQASPDTIVFHNDSIWSNFNKNDGLYEEKYLFVDYSLISSTDASGNILEYPIEYPTRFVDSTCTLYFKRNPASNFDEWDKYVKVD